MNRTLVGALAALLMVAIGVFWWQGRAASDEALPPPQPATAEETAAPGALPSADVAGLHGPALPEASEASREQRRFARMDRDKDGRVTRNELLSTRTNAFRKLDRDGNNLLTFEEWAVTTVNRFAKADANGDLWLSPPEFSTTKPKPAARPACKC